MPQHRASCAPIQSSAALSTRSGWSEWPLHRWWIDSLHYSDALEACKPVLRLLLRRFEGQHSFHNFTVELEQGSDKAKGTIFSFKCVPSQVCRLFSVPTVNRRRSPIERSIESFASSRRLCLCAQHGCDDCDSEPQKLCKESQTNYISIHVEGAAFQ